MLVAARARRWGAPLATATNTKKGQLTKNQLSLFAFWGCKISLDHTALLEQPALQELPALLELAALLVCQLCWCRLPLHYGLLRFSCALQLVIAVLAEIGQNQLMLL